MGRGGRFGKSSSAVVNFRSWELFNIVVDNNDINIEATNIENNFKLIKFLKKFKLIKYFKILKNLII